MPNMPVRRNRENRLARRENDHMKKILQPLFFLKYESEDLYIGGNGRHRFYGSCIAVFFFPL